MRKNKAKLRQSMRYLYMSISVIVFALTTSFLYKYYFNDSKYEEVERIYNYNDTLKTEYTVNISPNPYIPEPTLEMGKVYVTEYIDSIDFNFYYDYYADKKAEIEYEYSAIGTLIATYMKDGEEQIIFQEEETLIDSVIETVNSNNIKDTKSINVDVSKYNEKVKNFEKDTNIDLNALYRIRFVIKPKTIYQNEEISHEMISETKVEIGAKTTTIVGEFEQKNDGNIITRRYVEKDIKIYTVVINIILAISSFAVFVYVFTSTKPARVLRNEYRRELNKILKLCQDKIVQVNTRFDTKGAKVIEVKDFSEIIKLSEELFKPILYYNLKETEESWFYVISNTEIYRFVLKR